MPQPAHENAWLWIAVATLIFWAAVAYWLLF
jgi:hypothetical protein